uniref:Uncharacterized protein n=1 Tax=Romanomermis culicivorax TaxID=13658 RepID=A0A915J2F8_ROMCU
MFGNVSTIFSFIFVVLCVVSDVRCRSVSSNADEDALDKILASADAVQSVDLHKRQLSPAASLQKLLDYYRSAYNRMPSLKADHQMLRKDVGF